MLTEAELVELVAEFSAAAQRAKNAGFDAVEIHAAHGYLLHQFLSPVTNQRSDSYGGSLENRARLLLNVASAVRSALGSATPLMLRFSATDYLPDGWNLEETIQVAKWGQGLGVDLFDLSSGGIAPGVTIQTGLGYQVPFAQAVRENTGAFTAAVGEITSATQAEEIVAGGKADAVLIGRAMLRDPHWPLRAADELNVEVSWPEQYNWGRWTS